MSTKNIIGLFTRTRRKSIGVSGNQTTPPPFPSISLHYIHITRSITSTTSVHSCIRYSALRILSDCIHSRLRSPFLRFRSDHPPTTHTGSDIPPFRCHFFPVLRVRLVFSASFCSFRSGSFPFTLSVIFNSVFYLHPISNIFFHIYLDG